MDSGQSAILLSLVAHAEAICAKDADRALSSQADELVLFDPAPPLARTGVDALQRNTPTSRFDAWLGAICYGLLNFAIAVAQDMGFAGGFVRIGGTKRDGHEVRVRSRQTTCLRNQGSAGKIMHEHISTPFHKDGLQSIWSLKP